MKDFEEFSILLGCAANAVPNIIKLKEYVDAMSKLGYNVLYLETADTYKIEQEPYFGYMRGGYTISEINELDEYCKSLNIELVPAIQTLAHLHFLKHYACYQDIIDVNDILLVDEERTYQLIDNMFNAISKMYSSKRINIGMDESYLLGAGKLLYKHGYEDRLSIMLRHLNKVLKIAEKYNFSCEMWSDMFFNIMSKGNVYESNTDDIPVGWKELIPKNLTLVYWEYYVAQISQCEDMIDKHRSLSSNIKFAGGMFRWYGVTPGNVFSNKVMKKAMTACKNKKVKNVIFALWSDYSGGASLFSILPTMFYLSKYAHNGCNENGINLDEFYRLFNIKYEDFCLLDTLNKPDTDFITKQINAERFNNKSYFYLFNDIFYGTFDDLVNSGSSFDYNNVACNLAKIDAGKYAYIFETLINLAKVLAIKSELSIRIRKAYTEQNFDCLSQIVYNDFPKLFDNLSEFWKSFTNQWMIENKPFGFEVQCIRIGGLKERLKYAQNTIIQFLNGEIKNIAELDEKQQPFGYATERNGDNYQVNRYDLVVSHGFI